MAKAMVGSGFGIDYTDLGKGEPALLLMPGWCSSRGVFEPLVPILSKQRRTLALDWRGHGESDSPTVDFGEEGLVQDALGVIEASGARQVIPVAQAHASWVAVELRRRLGPRIPELVLLDWIILDPPPPFVSVLEGLQDPDHWHEARSGLFDMWLEHVDNPQVVSFVKEDMGSYGREMWARAGREIAAAYARAGNGLSALQSLEPPVPVLHLYAQPTAPEYLAAQQAFAAQHPWFQVQRLDTNSHFPTLEVPEQIAAAIERFVPGD